MTTLDLFLAKKIIKPEPMEFKYHYFSKELGGEVVIRYDPITMNRLEEIKSEVSPEEFNIFIVLECDTDGIFKSQDLMDLYKAPSPEDLVKSIFKYRPGDLQETVTRIERQAGFRQVSIEDLKKKSEKEAKSQ